MTEIHGIATVFDRLIANTLRPGSPNVSHQACVATRRCRHARTFVSGAYRLMISSQNSTRTRLGRMRSLRSGRNIGFGQFLCRFATIESASFQLGQSSRRVQRGNWWEAVQSAFPRGSRLVSVGSPVYPSPNRAILYFVQPAEGGGVLLLVREGRGWRIAGYDGWIN